MTSSVSEQKIPENTIERREILPENVLPIHYFLSYSKIDFDGDFAFEGRVEIDLDIKACTNEIIVNSRDIVCKCVSVVQNTEQSIDIQSLKYSQEKEQLTIPLTNELIVGTAKLLIDFTGFMNNKMKGFYRSKYCTADGKPAFCGITQFEPVDARCAFPCFDEPGKKATFSVQLTFPADLICLANMPSVKETIIDSRLKCVLFDRTPIMSVYLLAWCIGEFEYIENKTERGIAVRLWTTAGNTNKVQFALKCACRCLDFYEQYFGINYPLPKCDMIAVPDFAAGAMENWGLVTYREARLMCDESTAALRVKQRISLVICHELAHQWFGNLVTMDWWSQIWLNEGFARFMEYFCTDALFPDWNIWYLFFPAAFNRAFSLDAMRNSHAIEMDNVFTHSDIEQVFDSIAYAKGAAVVRMVVSFIGYEVFQKALHKYLKHFQYKNAKTNQLWAFLSKESGKPMADIMGNWTKKQGFPLICVSRAGNELTFTQNRYLSFGEPTEEENTIWNVPICMKLDGNASKVVQFVLKSRKGTFDISSSIINNKCDWVHINADSTGFYCCKYDTQMMQCLTKTLMMNDGQLSVVDRVCLIRDLRALAISCNTKTATLQLLDLVQSLSTKEKTYLVWNEMLTATSNISHIINCMEDDTEVYNKFKSIMRSILQHIYQDLQWQSMCISDDISENKESGVNAKESESTKDLFRPLILSSMIKYGHEDVIEETMKRYHSYMNLMFTENTDVNVACSSTDAVGILPSSLRSMAYACAVKYGGEKEYNLLKKYYLQVSDSIEKRSALRCLGKTLNIGLMESTLEWLLVSEDVRPQDKMFVFHAIAHASNKGKELAWDFLRKKWKIFFDMFDGGFQMSSLVKIPNGFVSNGKAEEVEQFFQSLDQASISGCYRGINQCVEQIRKNAKWRDSELLNIQKWCLNNYKG